MGVNAQTTVPTFTAGQVLTAAQMNNSARTGVPVFADTTARDAGFGGTGEKVLAEGQLCYVENLTGDAQIQYYDGAAWQSLSAPGLTLITGSTFTTVTGFNLPNDSFTATYDNYRLMVLITAAAADADFTGRMRLAGTNDTGNNYESMWLGYSDTGAAQNTNGDNISNFILHETDATIVEYRLTIDFFGPKLAQPTAILGMAFYVNKAATVRAMRTGGGLHTLSTAYDSFAFISSQNVTGEYWLYGYRDN